MSLALAGCGDDDGGIDGGPNGADGAAAGGAVATIAPTTGQTVAGTGTFTDVSGTVSVTVTVSGAAVGEHGVHIHQTGDCGMDGMNAGGHWDPDAGDHGMPGQDPSHLGDLGNMTVNADGTGTLTVSNAEWTIGDAGTTDVVGHAIVFHELMDDFGQPLGNAGGRFGCGVIAAQ